MPTKCYALEATIICKEMLDSLRARVYSVPIDNANGDDTMKSWIADTLYILLLTSPIAYIFTLAILNLVGA